MTDVTKHTVLLAVALLIHIHTDAQYFKGGLQAGLLASQVDGDNMEGYHKPGLYCGAFAACPFKGDRFELQAGIDYMQKGSKATNRRSEDELNLFHLTFHQIGLPVLFKWNFHENCWMEAGCSMNVTTSVMIRRDGTLYRNKPDNDTYRQFELGGICGLQWELRPHWSLHMRFLYSLTPVGKSHYRSIGLRNNSLLLGISYTFY